jgi:hypothetical protein
VSAFYEKMGRTVRMLETFPGVVVEPILFMGSPAYQITMTNEARAVLSEAMGVRPHQVDPMITMRVMHDRPLFTHKMTALPPEEGNAR